MNVQEPKEPSTGRGQTDHRRQTTEAVAKAIAHVVAYTEATGERWYRDTKGKNSFVSLVIGLYKGRNTHIVMDVIHAAWKGLPDEYKEGSGNPTLRQHLVSEYGNPYKLLSYSENECEQVDHFHTEVAARDYSRGLLKEGYDVEIAMVIHREQSSSEIVTEETVAKAGVDYPLTLSRQIQLLPTINKMK